MLDSSLASTTWHIDSCLMRSKQLCWGLNPTDSYVFQLPFMTVYHVLLCVIVFMCELRQCLEWRSLYVVLCVWGEYSLCESGHLFTHRTTQAHFSKFRDVLFLVKKSLSCNCDNIHCLIDATFFAQTRLQTEISAWQLAHPTANFVVRFWFSCHDVWYIAM